MGQIAASFDIGVMRHSRDSHIRPYSRTVGTTFRVRLPVEKMDICSSLAFRRPLPGRPTTPFAGFRRLVRQRDMRHEIERQVKKRGPLSLLAALLGSESRFFIDAWPSPFPSGKAAPVASSVASRPGWADGPQSRIPAPFVGLSFCRHSYATSNSKQDQGGPIHVL